MSAVGVDRDLKRFRQMVRSKIRAHATTHREPPALTMFVSDADRPRRVAAVRIGAARDAAHVAEMAREAIIKARPEWAAIGTTLRDRLDGGRTQGYGLVLCSRAGHVESWRAEFRAGTLLGWEEGAFDVGSTADLMRSAWVEMDRRLRLRALQDRLMATWQEDPQLMEKVGELGEGLEALLGNPLAEAPREPEAVFVAYVERWLEDQEVRNV